MQIAGDYIFYRAIVILLVFCQGVNADRKTNADSMRTVVDSLISAMRTVAKTEPRYDSMITLSDSIESLAKTYFADNDTSVAVALALRGLAQLWKGNDVAAESSLCRSIRTWQASQGVGCPQQAAPIRILADLYGFQHRDVESESLYRRALKILANSPPYKGSWTSRWMQALLSNNLGLLYAGQGRYKEAIELYEEALRLWTEESGADSPDACTARLNLGAAARDLGDYATAEQHVRYALSVYDRPQSSQSLPQHTGDMTRLILAMICLKQGKADEAVSLLNRGVTGFEQSYGAMSRGMLPALEVGMVVESALGHWHNAAEYASRGVRIIEQTDSRNAADLSHYLIYLADFLYPQGKLEECAAAFDRANSLRQSFVRGAFSYASEKSKLLYLRQFPLIDYSQLSCAAETNDSGITASALRSVLFGKASILDALAQERQAALCSEDAGTKSLLHQYADICKSLAEMTISGIESGISTASQTVTSLYEQKDSLESTLSQQCSAFDSLLRMPGVSIARVTKCLPAKSVLWEFITYRPYVFNYPDSVVPRHYLAFTLDAQGQPTITDLGEAGVIDSLIAVVDQKVQAGSGVFLGENERKLESDLVKVTSQLTALVLDPLLKTAIGCDHIIVSPDGQLSLLPFEILPLSDGRYAIEQYEFSYVSTGRDLLKFKSPPKTEGSGGVVVAAPDFETSPSRLYAQAPVEFGRLTANRFRGPSDRTECLSVPFNPLPASAIEGNTVANLLESKLGKPVIFLTGPEASEDSIKHLSRPPRVLHLATHGYSCSKASYSNLSGMTESPLLYSGLALAGSNSVIRGARDSGDSREDGILTALEVSGLNLMGTELVVLGSCRAGAGTVVRGEGVYGLRRSFQLAGARSIIMSMFDVPDATAKELMMRFYTDWLSGTTKSKALRSAALGLMQERRKQGNSAHPLFWGGFILTGDCR